MNTPAHGQIITFSKVPPASYCSVGVRYRVDRAGNKGNTFRFENVEQGSATFDPAWAVRMSTFTVEG